MKATTSARVGAERPTRAVRTQALRTNPKGPLLFTHRQRIACCALLIGLAAPAASAAEFTEDADRAGLDLSSGKDGGFVWGDFNNDGFLDVLVNRDADSRLYFHDGSATDPTFTDVTATHAPGLLATNGRRSASAFDFDNDGDLDLARATYDRVEIYQNNGSASGWTFGYDHSGTLKPSFVYRRSSCATATWQLDPPSGRCIDMGGSTFNVEGMAVIDYDNDGWLDLLVDNDSRTYMFQNPADATGATAFSTLLVGSDGIFSPDPGISGIGDYVVTGDIDGDGDVDMVLRKSTLADVWLNDGDGTFSPEGSVDFSVDGGTKGGNHLCDVDNDGDLDLFFSDVATDQTATSGHTENQFYLWDTGTSAFIATANSALSGNTAQPPVPTGLGSDVAGVACGDVDNDGDIDVFLADSASNDKLYLNQLADSGQLTFVLASSGTFDSSLSGIADEAGMVDFDADGDLDIYVNHASGNRLWRNDHSDADRIESTGDASGDAFLRVRVLADVAACPSPVTSDDVGATAILRNASNAVVATRHVHGGKGHGGQAPPVLHFGLGANGQHATYSLEIRPHRGGSSYTLTGIVPSLLTDQTLTTSPDDNDGDGIPNSVEQGYAGIATDVDNDGAPNFQDRDADGDGIDDDVEFGGANGCGTAADTNMNSVPDFLEAAAATTATRAPTTR